MTTFSQFNDYQHRALATAAVRQKGRAGRVWSGLEFSGEALELAATISGLITKSQFRPKGKSHGEFRTKLWDELGDMLWTLAVLAGQFDMQLGDIAESNLQKVGQKHADLEAKHGRSDALPVLEPVVAVSEKPENPFPWVSGSKKDITECPICHAETAYKEGCVSCIVPSCGWSACG